MTSAYPEAIKTELYVDGSWVDVSRDVLSCVKISVKYGIFGGGPLDRIASPGSITFMLRNDAGCIGGKEGYYSPGHSDCWSGFGVGVYVLQTLTWGGRDFPKFFARIYPGGIEVAPGNLEAKRVEVTAMDYMHALTIHELLLPEYTTTKRADHVVPMIVANMPVQPDDDDYHQGYVIFNTVFDTVRSRTKAITEIKKLMTSELGYCYVRRSTTSAEVLTVESRADRTILGDPAKVRSRRESTGFLLKEDGGYLLKEDGGKIILEGNKLIEAVFDNSMIQSSVVAGRYHYNSVKVITYPRRQSLASETLYELQNRKLVKAGETVTLTGKYRDPTSRAKSVSGINMDAPEAGTNYDMVENYDGTGGDLTADLSVTAVFGTSSVEYTLTNSGATDGYAWIKATGIGVYIDEPVEVVAEDDTSIAEIGRQQLTVDMKYQDDPNEEDGLAETILDRQCTDEVARVSGLESVTFVANVSYEMMSMFMWLDIGDRVRCVEDVSGVSRDYYIQGVTYEIEDKMITFDWSLKPAEVEIF